MSHVCSKGWGARCPASKGPRCKCRCGGHNHGNPKARPDHDAGDDTLPLTPSKELYYRPGDVIERLGEAELRAPDQRAVCFERESDPPRARVLLRSENRLTHAPLPRTLVYHSPTGFEFGYGGSGPADLALNILALVVSPKEAMHLHQQFKWDFIARAKAGDVLPLSNVRDWIARAYAAEIAADQAFENGDTDYSGMAEAFGG